MARKYNLDEHIAAGDPLHPETHEAIAKAVNDLDDRTAGIETDLTTRLSPTELSTRIAEVAAGPTVSDTIRNNLLDGLRLVRVTQAEYDALPTSRSSPPRLVGRRRPTGRLSGLPVPSRPVTS